MLEAECDEDEEDSEAAPSVSEDEGTIDCTLVERPPDGRPALSRVARRSGCCALTVWNAEQSPPHVGEE